MARHIVALLMSVAAMVSGCGETEQGNFVLFVSNQSFAIPGVDIRVKIDGRTVANERFRVGDQHQYERFRLWLQPGKHTLQVSSAKGEAELSTQFVRDGQRGALICYWHETHGNPAKHFTFELVELPLRIL